MQLVIKIDMDNSAWEDHPCELENVFERIVNSIDGGATAGKILDSNGNQTGEYKTRE